MKYPNHQSQLSALKQKLAYRQIRTLESQGHCVTANKQELVNFSSNDYLGLAADEHLQKQFFEESGHATPHWMSASSSRILTGTSASHTKLERLIAESYKKTGALLFNSGYHANTGILPALTSKQDLVLVDKLVHASLIDGLQLGKARFKRFSHNDIEHLDQLLETHRDKYLDVWIVTESLFSMDGDTAPLDKLIELKQRHQCYLYVDEAHAVGCFGKQGLGLAEENNAIDEIDILVGTFGKALAGCGGFVTGDQVLIETMVNASRSWLFSTALPPVNIDWNSFIWQRLEDFGEQRETLHRISKLFRQGLEKINKHSLGDAYIVAMIESGNKEVIALSENLQQAGVLAMPIRSPTVAIGSERIRFSLTANMPEQAISHCLVSINDL